MPTSELPEFDEKATYTATAIARDAVGNTAIATDSDVYDINHPVVVNPGVALLDEDAIVGTSDDDSYDPDVKTATGNLNINVGNDGIVSVEFVPQTTITASNVSGALTSEGETIVVSSEGSQKLVGTAHGDTIFEITLNEADGTYTFNLYENIDHPDMSTEDLIDDITFQVKVTDGDGDTGIGVINVDIADDIPCANDSNISIDLNPYPVNLVFTLDISGSMGNDVDGTNQDRLEIAIDAINNLVSEYENLGHNVNVQINTFSTNASGNTAWMNSTELSGFLDNLNHDGWTNYEDALATTQESYENSIVPEGTTYAYFLSDGNPTVEINDGSDDNTGVRKDGSIYSKDGEYIDKEREIAWNKFISDNNIEEVYAVGIGTSVSTEYLSQVSSNVIEVDNPADLSSTLKETVVYETGSLDFCFGADGAADGSGVKEDGGKLPFTWEVPTATSSAGQAVALTWAISANGQTLVGTDSSGNVAVRIEAKDIYSDNPTYVITKLDSNSGIENLSVPYTITDGDGDSVTAQLSVDVEVPNDPVPSSESESQDLEVCLSDTNLVLTLDMSASMTDPEYGGWVDTNGDNVGDTTRLQLAKDAIVNMINSYSNNGEVMVQLTVFDLDAQTTAWMTASEAIAHINAIDASKMATQDDDGWTNYEAAIDSTVDNFTNPNPSAKTIAYFISDGVPSKEMNDATSNPDDTTSNDNIGDKLDNSYINKWTSFINNNTDAVHSVGIGEGVENSAYLETMSVGSGAEYTSDLAVDDTLVGGIDSVSGNLLDNITWGTKDDGSLDKGAITSITIDGATFNVSDYTGTNTFNTGKGELEFNFTTGDYTYTNTEDDPTQDYSEVISLTAADSTGDVTTYDLTINVDLGVCTVIPPVVSTTVLVENTEVIFEDDFDSCDSNGWCMIQVGGEDDCNDVRIIADKDGDGDKELKLADGSTYQGFAAQTLTGAAMLTTYAISTDIDTSACGDNDYQNNAVGLVFGYEDINNYYKVIWDDFSDSYSNSDAYRDFSIIKVEDGTETQLAKVDGFDIYSDYGHTFNLNVEVDDSGIHAYINGDFVVEALGEQPAMETFGLWTDDNDSGVTYDNVKVESTVKATYDLDDSDDIDLIALYNQGARDVDSISLEGNNTNDITKIDLDEVVDLTDSDNELKIFGDDGDKVVLDEDSTWTNEGKETIDGDTFNVYQGTNGNSNIKILIDEDVSIDPDL